MLPNKKVFAVFSLSAFLLAGGPVWGANKQEELKQLESEITTQRAQSKELKERSETLGQQAEALRAELIALSQSVQQREANVTRLESKLAELTRDEEEARHALEKRYAQSVETLMALQRLALNPPQAIIAQPQEPADMVRSAILLRTIVPHIQEQAIILREDVKRYSEKRILLARQKEQLGLANVDLDKERRRLDRLIRQKKQLSRKYLADSSFAQDRVAQLTRKAKDLRALLARLARDKKQQAAKREQEKKHAQQNKAEPRTPVQKVEKLSRVKPVNSRPIAKSRGNLTRPASGPVVMLFGEKEKLGGKHKGISIKTRHGAQIVATYDGQIAFAGPFRGYKQLLIIDHGDGFHTLLTGMDHLDVSVGQWLLSGEPIGVMSSKASGDANLYFELRKNGAPINPLPWLRQQNAKAQG